MAPRRRIGELSPYFRRLGATSVLACLLALASVSVATANPQRPSRPAQRGAKRHRGPRGIVRARPARRRGSAHISAFTPFPASYEATINGYFANVAGAGLGSVYETVTQYWDGSPSAPVRAAYGSDFSALTNTYDDTQPLPPPDPACVDQGYSSCVTDGQIQQEIDAVATQQGWPRGTGSIFFLVTPPGVGSCFFDSTGSTCYDVSGGYCGYHNDFAAAAGETIYANIPYGDVNGCRSGEQPNSNAADATINVISHEHAEAITDPEGSAPGWYDTAPSGPYSGMEIGDLCAADYGPAGGMSGTAGHLYNQTLNSGHYFIQSEWSNQDAACRLGESADPGAAPAAGGPNGVSYQGGPVVHAGNRAYVIYWNPAGTRPTAAISVAGGTFFPGQPIALQASSDSATQFGWDFGDGATGTGASVAHAYAAPGTYTVALTASNGSASTTVRRTVTVSAHSRPVAAFVSSAPAVLVGQQATFDGSPSSDADGGGLVAWSWSFGDGATATGARTSHAYATPGAYTVTLTVTDAAGLSGSSAQTVVVTSQPATPAPPPKAAMALRGIAVSGLTLRALLGSGLPITINCSGPCPANARLLLRVRATKGRRRQPQPVEVGRVGGRAAADGSLRLVLKLSAAGRRRLRHAGRPALSVVVDAAGAELIRAIRLR